MMLRNYWPNPRAVSSGRKPTQLLDGTIAWRWGDDGIGLNPSSAATFGPYMMWSLTGLPAKTKMILYAEVGGGTSGNLRGPFMEVTTPSDSTLAVVPAGYPQQRVNQLSFTTPADGSINVKFRGSDSTAIVFYDLCLMTATDFQIMQSLGLDQFDGSLMPLAS